MARQPLYGHLSSEEEFKKRVNLALELAETCIRCGRNGLKRRTFASGSSQPGNCECGGRGHIIREIAAKIGCAKTTAGTYLSDPNKEKEHARRAKYKGECCECGGPTDSSKIYRCRWCTKGEPSPHVVATSPTGFRNASSSVCRCCGGPKAPGRHVCRTMAERLDEIRIQIEERAATWDYAEHRYKPVTVDDEIDDEMMATLNV